VIIIVVRRRKHVQQEQGQQTMELTKKVWCSFSFFFASFIHLLFFFLPSGLRSIWLCQWSLVKSIKQKQATSIWQHIGLYSWQQQQQRSIFKHIKGANRIIESGRSTLRHHITAD
jgi:hypothetical protein